MLHICMFLQFSGVTTNMLLQNYAVAQDLIMIGLGITLVLFLIAGVLMLVSYL